MKHRARLFLIALAMSSAACSSPDDVADAVGGQDTRKAPASSHVEAPEAVAISHSERVNGGAFDFDYAWPAAVSAEPALAAKFRADADRMHTEQKTEWHLMLVPENEDCEPCRSLGYALEWKVVADTPRFLSLSTDLYSYTGGAHGNYGMGGLVWDREAQSEIEPVDVFRSGAALSRVARVAYCDALDAERRKRRGEPYDGAEGDLFTDCPPFESLTILLGSTNGETFDRIGLVADPYVAGPYAEGYYDITLPVDSAILDAVKPEYRSAFSLHPRK